MPGGGVAQSRVLMGSLQPRTRVIGQNGTAFLDLLRASAANLVLFGHTADIFQIETHLSAGSIGVGVFFLLSGFLIMQSCLARLQRPGPHFASYMIDRFARIFTPYVPVLFLVAAIGTITDLGHWGQSGISTGPVALIGNLLLMQDYPIFQVLRRLVGDAAPYVRPYNTAEPFWTISIEFWIYVVFGLGFFGLVMRERTPRVVGVLLGGIALPVVIWNAAAGGGNGLALVWLVGAAGAYVWTDAWHRNTRKLQLGIVVLLIGGACLFSRGIKIGWNFQDLGLIICEMLTLIGGLSVIEGMQVLSLTIRTACTFLASYSYSLYLAHNTVLIVMRQTLPSLPATTAIPLALLTAHAVAIVLYLLFERHYHQVGIWLKRLIITRSDADGTPRRTLAS